MKIAYPNTLSPSPIGKGGSYGDFLVTLCNGYLARTFFVSAHMRVDIRPFFFRMSCSFEKTLATRGGDWRIESMPRRWEGFNDGGDT